MKAIRNNGKEIIILDKSKIELFKRDNPSKEFPAFRSLTLIEQKTIARGMSEKLGLGAQEDFLIIAKAIVEKGTPIKGSNAEDENFELSKILSGIGIQPEENIYINWWYKYDDIDEISFIEFNKHFADIWFPGPDDIDIFDSTFAWIIHIDHDGYISFIK